MEEEQKCKCPAGIPAWVLTFADLMSLLMCFFVLLLSFAEMDVQKFKQIAGSMKAAFGVQRDIKAVEIPKGVNIVAREFSPSPPQPTVINEVRQTTSDETHQELKLINKLERLQSEENVLKDKMENMSEAEAESEGLKKQLKELQVEKAEVEKELSTLKEKMDQLQEQQIKDQTKALSAALEEEIEAEMIEVESGKNSITIRIKDKGSFASGTARLTEDFIEILELIEEEPVIPGGVPVFDGRSGTLTIPGLYLISVPDFDSKTPYFVEMELVKSNEILFKVILDTFSSMDPPSYEEGTIQDPGEGCADTLENCEPPKKILGDTYYSCDCIGSFLVEIIPTFSCGSGYVGGDFGRVIPNLHQYELSRYLPDRDRQDLIASGESEYSSMSGWKCKVQGAFVYTNNSG